MNQSFNQWGAQQNDKSQAASIREPSQPTNGTRENQRKKNIIGTWEDSQATPSLSKHSNCYSSRSRASATPIVDGVVRSLPWMMGPSTGISKHAFNRRVKRSFAKPFDSFSSSHLLYIIFLLVYSFSLLYYVIYKFLEQHWTHDLILTYDIMATLWQSFYDSHYWYE
jgi:hypothetical protein